MKPPTGETWWGAFLAPRPGRAQLERQLANEHAHELGPQGSEVRRGPGPGSLVYLMWPEWYTPARTGPSPHPPARTGPVSPRGLFSCAPVSGPPPFPPGDRPRGEPPPFSPPPPSPPIQPSYTKPRHPALLVRKKNNTHSQIGNTPGGFPRGTPAGGSRGSANSRTGKQPPGTHSPHPPSPNPRRPHPTRNFAEGCCELRSAVVYCPMQRSEARPQGANPMTKSATPAPRRGSPMRSRTVACPGCGFRHRCGTKIEVDQGTRHGFPLSFNPDDGRFYVHDKDDEHLVLATFKDRSNAVYYCLRLSREPELLEKRRAKLGATT